jgi:hypothetical protein
MAHRSPRSVAVGAEPRPAPFERRRYTRVPVPSVIHSVVPAEPGWWAFYSGELAGDAERARVVAWGLVGDEGQQEVVGLVVSQDDPAKVVSAREGASVLAPELDRYGFREL